MANELHERMAALALRLIEKHGRDIEIIRLDRTPSDADKPWRMNPNARAAPAVSYTVKGVFVPLTTSKKFFGVEQSTKDETKRAEQAVLVAADGIDADLVTFDEIVDNGQNFKILDSHLLRPGDLRLVYGFEVKR